MTMLMKVAMMAMLVVMMMMVMLMLMMLVMMVIMLMMLVMMTRIDFGSSYFGLSHCCSWRTPNARPVRTQRTSSARPAQHTLGSHIRSSRLQGRERTG